jgi:peroxiredoxin Q/BCP
MNLKAIVASLMAVGMLGALIVALFTQPTQAPEEKTPTPSPSEVPSISGSADAFESLYLLPKDSFAPRIQAKAANGSLIDTQAFQKKGEGAVIIFYQGVFCSVCAGQLEGFQQKASEFKKKGYNIIAISADTLSDAQARQGKSGLSFPVIPDPDRTIISNYGAVNVTRGNIAYPAVYVIDKAGKVAFSFADKDMTRLSADALLKEISTSK